MCRKGSLTAAPLTFWAGQVFVGGLSVHRRVFRASLASGHQTDANSTALPPPDSITTTQNIFTLCQKHPEGKLPLSEKGNCRLSSFSGAGAQYSR